MRLEEPFDLLLLLPLFPAFFDPPLVNLAFGVVSSMPPESGGFGSKSSETSLPTMTSSEANDPEERLIISIVNVGTSKVKGRISVSNVSTMVHYAFLICRVFTREIRIPTGSTMGSGTDGEEEEEGPSSTTCLTESAEVLPLPLLTTCQYSSLEGLRLVC